MKPDLDKAINAVLKDLRNSLSWMDLVMENLKEGVLVVGRDMRIAFTNTAFADMAGVPRIMMLGCPLWEVVPLSLNKQDMFPELKKMEQHFTTLKHLNGVYELKDKKSIPGSGSVMYTDLKY